MCSAIDPEDCSESCIALFAVHGSCHDFLCGAAILERA